MGYEKNYMNFLVIPFFLVVLFCQHAFMGNAESASKKPYSFSPVILHQAAACGDLDTIHKCLAHGVPVDAKNDKGETALHVAIRCGHIDAMDCLISKKASLLVKDHDGKNVFEKVVQANNYGMAQALCTYVRKYLDICYNLCPSEHQWPRIALPNLLRAPLACAIKEGKTKVACVFLKNGAETGLEICYHEDPGYLALVHNNTALLDYMFNNRITLTSMDRLLLTGDADAVSNLFLYLNMRKEKENFFDDTLKQIPCIDIASASDKELRMLRLLIGAGFSFGTHFREDFLEYCDALELCVECEEDDMPLRAQEKKVCFDIFSLKPFDFVLFAVAQKKFERAKALLFHYQQKGYCINKILTSVLSYMIFPKIKASCSEVIDHVAPDYYFSPDQNDDTMLSCVQELKKYVLCTLIKTYKFSFKIADVSFIF